MVPIKVFPGSLMPTRYDIPFYDNLETLSSTGLLNEASKTGLGWDRKRTINKVTNRQRNIADQGSKLWPHVGGY